MSRVPTRSPRPTLHRESLLQIPLVRAAFAHPRLAPRPRAVDLRWHYAKLVEQGSAGFAPLSSDVYYGRHSRLAQWLPRPEGSARRFNEEDHLVREVLFCAHDFLHAWAFAAVRAQLPALDPGRPCDLEVLAFVHLVTEAAATVGLDYWYLSTREPEEICDLGSLRFPLTTSYHERYLTEYRRFRPDLVVQQPEFFVELATFYCTGRWKGFSGGDLARSPRLSRWLSHEVAYGERQRGYIRAWLGFMAGSHVSEAEAARPVRCDEAWQRALVRSLGGALWRLVQSGESARHGKRAAPIRWPRHRRSFDPRFVNVGRMSLEAVNAAAREVKDPAQLTLLCDQIICAHDFASFEHRLRPALTRVREARDVPALIALFRGARRVPVSPDEPETLFLLG